MSDDDPADGPRREDDTPLHRHRHRAPDEAPPRASGIDPLSQIGFGDDDVNPSGRLRPLVVPPKRSRAWRVAGRAMTALVGVSVLLASGIWWSVGYRADQTLGSRSIDALVPDDPSIATPSGQADAPPASAGAQQAGTTPAAAAAGLRATGENILVLGLDTRPDGQQTPDLVTSQSDVIMVAHISADRKLISVLSIPRDLWVKAPRCKAWDYADNRLSDHYFASTTSRWKITNAFAVGGPQCTVRAVQELTGLRINRLIAIDFAGFKATVDALGGLTIRFYCPITDAGTVIVSAAGTQTIAGDKALSLVRARHVFGDPTGDLGRIHRQQITLTTLLAQMSSSRLLANPVRLDKVLQAFLKNTSTSNVSYDYLVNLAGLLGGQTTIAFSTLPTVQDDGDDGLDQGPGTSSIFQDLINDRPVPDPGAAAPAPVSDPGVSDPGVAAPGGGLRRIVPATAPGSPPADTPSGSETIVTPAAPAYTSSCV